LQRALTLVVAPAGFGKTTLLASWASTAQLPVAWLSLDPADTAPIRFLNYLIDSIQQIAPQAGGTAAALLRGGQTFSEEGVLYSLIDDFAEIPHDFALVLDDYHTADNPKIAEITGFLLENRLANLHLLIASRTTPDLNLARMRARDQLTEITTADLRFNHEEIRAFLEGIMDVKLDTDDLMRLDQSTEGWAVGLQLAAIALARQPINWDIPTGHIHIFEYLAEEVLRREPLEVQTFLTRTALFDRFCAPLCETLFEGSLPVTDLLAYVERSNLFLVPLDASGTWFRYHALFAEFLRQRMERLHPEQAPVLYSLASQWSQENGILEDAIHYATHAGDFETAVDLIESTYQELLQRGEQAAMLDWLSNLPQEMLKERPRLLLAKGWASIISVDADQAMECAESAGALIPTGESSDRLRGEASALRILAGIFRGQTAAVADISEAFILLSEQDTFLHSLLHFNLGLNSVLSGETHQAVEAFNETIQLTGDLNNPLVTIIALTQLGECYQIRGELVLAERAFQQAIRFARESLGEHTVLQGMPYVSYADLLREQNRFEEAVRYGEQGIAYCQIWQPMASMDGYLALARLETGRRNWGAAETCFEQALQTAERTSTPLDDTFVTLFRVRAYLLGGDLPRASQWMQTISAAESTDLFYHFREMIELVRLRVRVLRGEPITSELAGLLPEVERRERVSPHIEALILGAYAFQHTGLEAGALDYLNLALAMGARGGYVRIFADEGQPMLDILERQQGKLDVPSTYLKDLLEVLRGEAAGAVHQPPDTKDRLVSLTRRELDVLRQLADGKSNQEIADELVLALNTIKKHVANILGKMGVANRTQAVMEAKKSGWIE
jgi:LuxR family maltose regulon positive regulatory protein